MALGDSITAGLLAGPSTRSDEVASSLLKEGSAPVFGLPPPISEYRGLSYPIGSDPDAITFPNILSQFTSRNLTGPSRGKHIPMGCVLGYCGHGEEDGLNAAMSGSVSLNLYGQVKGMAPISKLMIALMRRMRLKRANRLLATYDGRHEGREGSLEIPEYRDWR
jgi:phospholipase B1